jgi:hypothetical protein
MLVGVGPLLLARSKQALLLLDEVLDLPQNVAVVHATS